MSDRNQWSNDASAYATKARTEDEQREEAERRRLARQTAAQYATDADDLRLLLDVLGLGATDTALCGGCGDPINRSAAAGYNRPAGDGLCGRCFGTIQRARQRAKVADL